jgi:hypothetical protein
MGLFQYINFFPLRIFFRYTSHTRLQVFQNAIQIVDPQRIRNVGIIAHIDAGILIKINKRKSHDFFLILFRQNNNS